MRHFPACPTFYFLCPVRLSFPYFSATSAVFYRCVCVCVSAFPPKILFKADFGSLAAPLIILNKVQCVLHKVHSFEIALLPSDKSLLPYC